MPSQIARCTFRCMSTFLEVVELLLTNNDAKTAYTNNPEAFLDQHGLGALDSNDVSDAMGHAADALPMSVAAQLDPEAGLDAAAAVDLEELGLSLEREPILDAETPATDVDPDDLDSAAYGDDVDFDTPDTTEHATDTQSSTNFEELDLTPSNTLESASDVAEEGIEPNTAPDLGTHSDELSDDLTELPIEELPDETTLDDADFSLGGTADPLDDLDVDLSTDLPDDFDLLD